MTINYPSVAFAFNPIMVEISDIPVNNFPGYNVGVTFSNGIAIHKIPVNGKILFDLTAIAQSLFNRKEFYQVIENDTILMKKLEFELSDFPTTSIFKRVSIDVIWGALDVGETYKRTKTLTWFKNLPFTFPLFLQDFQSLNVEIDNLNKHFYSSFNPGKYNISPIIEANKKAVFSIALKPILTVSPLDLKFNGTGESESVQIIIQNQPDASYSVTVPSWLTVSNQTQTGFTLTAGENSTGEQLSDEVVVTLDDYPDQTQTIEVSQAILPITILTYDASIDQTAHLQFIVYSGWPNDDFSTLVIDWGDGTSTPVKADQIYHTYPDTGIYTATIINMVNIPYSMSYGSLNLVGVKIFGSIETINPLAFAGCTNLRDINISNVSIKRIGGEALRDCIYLSGIIKLNDVEEINLNAFSRIGSGYKDPNNSYSILPNSPYLTVDFGNSPLTTIIASIFSNVYNLQTLILSPNTTIIQNDAFLNCWSLENLTIPGQNMQISGTAFSGGVRLHGTIKINASSIADTSFSNVGNLNNTVSEEGLTFDLSDSTFITIGTPITGSGTSGSINKIIYPNTLQSMISTLYPGSTIHSLQMLATVPPNIVESIFNYMAADKAIYVPDAPNPTNPGQRVIDDYKGAAIWSGYQSIIHLTV